MRQPKNRSSGKKNNACMSCGFSCIQMSKSPGWNSADAAEQSKNPLMRMNCMRLTTLLGRICP